MAKTVPRPAPRDILLRFNAGDRMDAHGALAAAIGYDELLLRGERIVTIDGTKYDVTCTADRIVVEVVE